MKSSTHLFNGLVVGLSTAMIGYVLISGNGPNLRKHLPASFLASAPGRNESETNATTLCSAGAYTTELLSLDPPIIYINNFLLPEEMQALLTLGNGLWINSTVSDDPSVASFQHPGRTSSTAYLPKSAPVVACVLERARRFLGFYDFDEIEAPQLTRYAPGQQYEAHFDWPPTPWRESAHGNLRFDRFATFFVYVEANCTGGSTHFPRVSSQKLPHPEALDVSKFEVVPVGESGYAHTESLAVRPITGNAVFWVNMKGEAQGDPLTKHAGMPVIEGSKIGLNIWSRRYLPDEK